MCRAGVESGFHMVGPGGGTGAVGRPQHGHELLAGWKRTDRIVGPVVRPSDSVKRSDLRLTGSPSNTHLWPKGLTNAGLL